MPIERPGAATFQGAPLTVLGPELKAGDCAPDLEVLDGDLNPVTLLDTAGKVRLITAVPSLDTPVCDLMTRRFNTEAAKLPAKVAVLTVSMDLPFAQKRFCATAGVDRVKVLSDHRQASFGLAYGVLIKELRLLARAVFVVDAKGVIRYAQYVKEIAEHPDYEKALEAARALAGS